MCAVRESAMGPGLGPGGYTSGSPSPPPSPLDSTNNPLLSQYDPYHNTTYYVQHPFSEPPSLQPLGGGTNLNACSEAYEPPPPVWDATKSMGLWQPKLDYQDFSAEIHGLHDGHPHTTDSIHDVISRANDWLRQNPNVRVRTCETMVWCNLDPLKIGDTEAVTMATAMTTLRNNPHTYYLIGIRLWLIPNTSTSQQVQRLHCVDIHSTSHSETLTQMVKRINKHMVRYPLPGKILNIETILAPEFNKAQSESLLWTDADVKRRDAVMVIRIVVVTGETQNESIGIKNICPEVVGGSHEPFSSLMKKAAVWLRDERGIHVINMRSCLVYRDNNCPEECAERCRNQMFQFRLQQYFQILRVFYVRQGSVSGPTSYTRLCYSVTFTPVQIMAGKNTETDFELMRQTMVRTTAWLKGAEADVFSVETFLTPLVPIMQTQELSEVTYWTPSLIPSETTVSKYIMHIRVYLDGDYKDPDPRTLPPLPQSLTYSLQNEAQLNSNSVYQKLRRRKRNRRICVLITASIIIGSLAAAAIFIY